MRGSDLTPQPTPAVTDFLGPLVDPSVKARRVRLIVTLVLIGTMAAIAYHYVAGFYLDLGYPHSTFLFKASDHFNDWYLPHAQATDFVRGAAAPFIYFPFGYLVIVAGSVLPVHVGLVLLLAVFLTVMALLLWKWVADCEEHVLTRVQYVFILAFLSYPVLFAVDRANLDLLLFVLVAGFFYFRYVRDMPWLAALFLAAAIAFKLYPASLLLVLLAERRYRSVLLTVGLAVVMTGGALLALGALSGHSLGEMVRMSSAEKGGYQQFMVYLGGGLQHSHTLWGMLRLPGFLQGAAVAGWETKTYTLLAAVVFTAIAVDVVFFEKDTWKRILLAVVPTLLLPFVSTDYTLLYLYFPLVFFVNSPRTSRWDTVYLVLFAVLLVPVDYYYVFYDYVLDGISISVVVYPLALVALLVAALLDRRRTPVALETGT